ncbi:MAG TPA: MMPL family transporter [Pseudomonadales bacterium]|nr:MMPL family transporter [Pseudomonadales bacterium]
MNDNAPVLERAIFGARLPLLLVFAGLTLFFGFMASRVGLDTSLEKMVPMKHPYIQNLFKHKDELGLGNDIRIAVAVKDGDIFTKEYLETLKKITDETYSMDAVDKSKIQSLWTPNVRWVEVTEDGFRGGEVIPPTYTGTLSDLDQVKTNVLRSGQVGRLVGDNFKSSIIYLPLIDIDSKGNKLNYHEFSRYLEANIRDKYQQGNIEIKIVGFAKKVGDLIDGAIEIATFFAIGILITFGMLMLYTRDFRGSIIVIICCMAAVVWQVGLLRTLGYGIDPYSMLVPFLIFAIGVSHSVQILSAITSETAKGADKVTAARLAFRALYIPATVAILADAFGFITLVIIDIGVIKELAIAASLGVGVVIITNAILIPLAMSYVGVSRSDIAHLKSTEEFLDPLWRLLAKMATPKYAVISIIISAVVLAAGLHYRKDLKIGDLDRGAPELRANSRYNLDTNYISDNYSIAADVLVVMVETPKEKCSDYAALNLIDRFQWYMENVPGVQSAQSVVTGMKRYIVGTNEGSLKWNTLSRNQEVLNTAIGNMPSGLINLDCSLIPVFIFLEDHKAETLLNSTRAVEKYAQDNEKYADKAKFVLASGNAGIEAATNQTVEASQMPMLMLVYGVVALLTLVAFRSLMVTICLVIPLMITSILCEAMMAQMGIGVKVATLPVVALGVGIGVDYGIYIYAKMSTYLKQGMPLADAYFQALRTTGRAVSFIGFTLAVGVGIWMFSAIKFQADMGFLLAFMFLWNMVGALWLLPALACFLVKVKPVKN